MKTLTFTVTIPNIPEGMDNEVVRDWLLDSLGHPEDAAYESSVRVEWASTYLPANPEHGGYAWTEWLAQQMEKHPMLDTTRPTANPERVGNGCMIHGEKK